MTGPAATFYALLGVNRDATPDDIRNGYRRQAQKYHPDKYRGRGDAAAIMAQINKAYEVLSDATQRAAYDQDMQAATPARPATTPAALGIGGWPWYLLSATLCLILLAIGLVVLKVAAPQRASYVPPLSATAPVAAEPLGTNSASPVQPWKEPAPRPVPLADDPVSRLVREGVINKP